MDRIRIGLTSPLTGNEILMEGMEAACHQRALERVDVEPVLLRNDMDALGVIDELGLQGLLFSGGGDIGAARYGGNEALANDLVDPQRDVFEFALMRDAFARALPIFAICRGMQLANVVLGGTLFEDIRHYFGRESAHPHHQVKQGGLSRNEYAHEISIAAGTVLYEFAGAMRVRINSFHHQAIKDLAPALRVAARADDGVIEAIEFAPDYAGANGQRGFFIGVQWHPEILPHDDLLSHGLYIRFARACAAP